MARRICQKNCDVGRVVISRHEVVPTVSVEVPDGEAGGRAADPVDGGCAEQTAPQTEEDAEIAAIPVRDRQVRNPVGVEVGCQERRALPRGEPRPLGERPVPDSGEDPDLSARLVDDRQVQNAILVEIAGPQ